MHTIINYTPKNIGKYLFNINIKYTNKNMEKKE